MCVGCEYLKRLSSSTGLLFASYNWHGLVVNCDDTWMKQNDTHRTLLSINRHETEPVIMRLTTRCASAHTLFWHISLSESIAGSRLLRLTLHNFKRSFSRLLCILQHHLRPDFIAQSGSREHRVRCAESHTEVGTSGSATWLLPTEQKEERRAWSIRCWQIQAGCYSFIHFLEGTYKLSSY